MGTQAVELGQLRQDVREFLDGLSFTPHLDNWMRGFDPAVSRGLGERGWLGMTVSPRHGGGGRSFVERFAVTEELLHAGAPVACHWIADRQIAPVLSRHGSEYLREEFLPGICHGEIFFCIGMSEPDAGSDVAAIRMRAERTSGGWSISGQKVWTTGAHESHYCYLVARTSSEDDRRAGLSEFIVPMDAPGLTVRPIEDLSGGAHFNELFFDEVQVGAEYLVGEEGDAFRQIMRQLGYERSGPERFLSMYGLFDALVRHASDAGHSELETLGSIASRVLALRVMAVDVAEAVDRDDPPASRAALMKVAGSELEQEIVEEALRTLGDELLGGPLGDDDARLREGVLAAPVVTIRAGTSEVMREVVARRGLGLGRRS